MVDELNFSLRQLFWGLCTCLIFFSCNSEKPEKTKTNLPLPAKTVTVNAPEFNADSCYSFLKKQVDFGPRTPNSKAHDACADYLVSTLKSYQLEVITQTGQQLAHDKSTLNFTNIFASYRPSKEPRILLTAHWDTRPWADHDTDPSYHKKPIDGANDGASGVAVLLEIARILSVEQVDLGIDILFFDVEDYGISSVPNSFCYGSQYWALNPTYENKLPGFSINLDMVGDKNATFYYEGYSNQYARHILDKVWASAHALGHEKMFLREVSYPITDDHLYVNKVGIPCIDIIHRDQNTGGFPSSWHTHEDQLKNIHRPTLKAVGETLLHLIYKENDL